MKNFFKILGSLFVIALLYLLLYPVDIEPLAYTPPPNPELKGVFKKNNTLATAQKILLGEGIGPEGIAISADSFLYTGFSDGKIIKFTLEGKKVADFADTGGRPLGMQFHPNGNLIVADEYKGLLSIHPNGEVELLTDEVDGTKIYFADDLDIAADGTIYFTDASQRNHDVEKEVWELQPTGRLISYHPSTKVTKMELPNLLFANGVAIVPNTDYLLVNETFAMVIKKYFYKGTKKGQSEIFINELPGYPDNITYNGNGTFWLAMPNVRLLPEFEALYSQPFLRKVVRRLPTSVTNVQEPPPYGMVVGFDLEGNITHNFQDTTGMIHDITSVIEMDSSLYLGSLKMDAVGKFDL